MNIVDLLGQQQSAKLLHDRRERAAARKAIAFRSRGPYNRPMSARSDLPDWLAHTLETAPRSPGCYLMVDRLGETVYIGKAQDLRARLSQYFQPSTSDTRFFVGLLDKVLARIDVIVTASVKDALLLENELIKRHQPRFNVKLKDDKNFLSIRVTAMDAEHPWPRLQIVRRRKKDGADYFGPFHSATAIRQTLKVISRHFQLRTCSTRSAAAQPPASCRSIAPRTQPSSRRSSSSSAGAGRRSSPASRPPCRPRPTTSPSSSRRATATRSRPSSARSPRSRS
jgi:hypothetical protein